MRTGRVVAVGCVMTLVLGPTAACNRGSGEDVVGLITKTDTNPFFVQMKKGAEAAAKEQGLELQSFAGKQDGDNEAQVQAIENLMSFGAKGFLITPNDSKAIVPSIDKAHEQNMLVIALDTPVDPPDAADATFATDNYQAGKLIGQWAKAKFAKDGKQAKIAMLDLNANQVSVDVKRDQGFLDGFGIQVGNPDKIGDENDPRIAGHDVTDGAEDGGRTAMENLLQKDPSINLVYTINEPAAAGAYQALKSAGRDKDTVIVSIDGGCPGVDNVSKGIIGATSMQFPLKMAQMGVDAIAAYTKDGTKPQATPGKDFVDTGVQLITDDPQAGVDAKDSTWGKQNCWG
ncbi:sugar ABC transporter substrate-binding protein [Actinoplanes sp. TBRC 11911]|uniref:sugar ABC transporter substrate-binding protein n=1 Tax=Actinoplanes sp. TBRC 11911 TaxID=2729386 RepID=UPI00145DD36A|nr:sugar ABC transporter substrate-binding protein [Actinoplanes sp. TBRC 11911]NMO54987.1 sugar ABC transporter substrate-binding protein [Actinoplanes sp. TBRC 11911]